MDFFLNFDWNALIDRIGNNPFEAMWFLFINGGWIIFLIVIAWCAILLFQMRNQDKFNAAKQWVIFAIHIPRMHEQGPRAIENMFAYLAGAHSPNSWTEDWFVGKTQDNISCEIVSIEGNVQFFIRTTRPLQDLVEAAVYAQYPDAEVTEVEDYTLKVPKHYPDEEWDVWGTQFVGTKSDIYPIKTYPMFEDKVSGEFKDPMSAFLESLSRVGKGEQVWFQILLIPIAQKEFSAKANLLVKKLTGQKVEHKKTWADHAAEIPVSILSELASVAFGGGGEHAKPAPKKPDAAPSKIQHMTEGEKEVVTNIENKAGKIVFKVKLRLVYVAKKTAMNKARVANTVIGAIKQINSNHMQSLKPDSAHVGMNSTLWWFKSMRNNERKTHLMSAYRGRSGSMGLPPMHLSTEELATLWHFPHSLQVKTPQLRKTDNKKAEPPANIPFE